MTEDTPNVNSQATQDQEIAKILSMPAPALAVPAASKDQWVDDLSAQIPHMVYLTERGASLAPVAAGQTVQDVIPLEWLGDYLLAYIPALGHWTPSRKLLTQTLMAVVPNIKPSYGLRQAEQIIEHAGALSPSYVLGDQPNIAELIARTWDAAPVITFKNGTLHVPSAQLRKHDPQYRTTWSVPFDWDPHAQSHQLDHFLESAVPDPVSRKNLLAFLGYALARYDTSQHQFVYLLGSGSNGKSLFLKLVRKALGAFWSNTSLGKLVGSRFGAGNLVFSALNFVGDQDAVYLANTEVLKETTGFDALDVEKKFRDSFPFIAKTKFMFAVNSLPPTKDVSFGFFRRPIIVEFPCRFAQNKGYEDQLLGDDTIVQALIAKAIDAYQAMTQNKGFWIEGRTHDLLTQYRAKNDVVYSAVVDGLVFPVAGARIKPWALTPLIALYAAEKEIKAPKQSQILENLGQAGFTVQHVKTGPAKAREHWIEGLAVDPAQARSLVDRAATSDRDGTATVAVGGKRIASEELLDAWGIPTIADPEIARRLKPRQEPQGVTRI